jgi:hypothetical protein
VFQGNNLAVCATGSTGEGKSRLLLVNLAETEGLLHLFCRNIFEIGFAQSKKISIVVTIEEILKNRNFILDKLV